MDTNSSVPGATKDTFADKIERLSKVQRILITVGIVVVVLAAAVWFLYKPKYEKINSLTDKLKKVEKQLVKAKKNAAELEKFQAKMREAEAQFKLAMKALPEKEEIPSLLTSISKSGQDVGLEFLLFEPKAENRKEFYAEIPVAMNIKGDYHNLAIFFDKVARLSRIVNIRGISMSRIQDTSDLSTTCTAVTYKFVEAEPPKTDKKKRRKRK
jgi:type IV pilus assembly protein PilO